MSLFFKIKNLFYWLPVVWNDRPDNYTYFNKILAHKLKQIQYYSRKSSLNTYDIDECLSLLHQLDQDEFIIDDLAAFKENYPESSLDRLSKEELEDYKLEKLALLRKEEILKQSAIDRLFLIISRKYRSW